MYTSNKILKSDIVEGAKFKTSSGIVWIIDKIHGERVHTSMSHGAKGNYKDDINTVLDFLNDENAFMLPFSAGYETLTTAEANKQIEASDEWTGEWDIIETECIYKCKKTGLTIGKLKTGTFYTMFVNDDIEGTMQECIDFLQLDF